MNDEVWNWKFKILTIPFEVRQYELWSIYFEVITAQSEVSYKILSVEYKYELKSMKYDWFF